MCEQLVATPSVRRILVDGPMLVVGVKPRRGGSKGFEDFTHVSVFGKATRAELDNNNKEGKQLGFSSSDRCCSSEAPTLR